MGYTNRYITVIFKILILSISSTISAQIGVSDELKKNLLKSANPYSSPTMNFFDQKLNSENSVLENRYINAYNNYKTTSILNDTEIQKYQIDKHVYTYTGKTPANQMPPGSYVPIYMGGRFVIASTAGSFAGVGGLNLTGWSPPKLSEKSKSILRYVYGMEIED